MSNEIIQMVSHWANKEQWGWDYDTYISPADGVDFLKAILVCTKGDDIISKEERDWVLGFAASREMPMSIIEELREYDGGEEITDIMSRNSIVKKGQKGAIYWAIKACSADEEYHEKEKAAIRKMAGLMGISEKVVEEIEEVIVEEKRLRDKRNTLVYENQLFWQDT